MKIFFKNLQEAQNTIVLFPFKAVFKLVTKGTKRFNLRKTK